MITYRSFVGLDVHARTIVGCAIDDQTGEVVHRRFGYDLAEVAAWVDSLPGPQTATYEAGSDEGYIRGYTVIGIIALVALVLPMVTKMPRPKVDPPKVMPLDATGEAGDDVVK